MGASKMRVPMADLQTQYKAIGQEINAAVQAVLESARFILGENVSSLEQEIAQYSGSKHGIAVG
ncbi:MAG TPA: DegT/DnrJ/EryC1/StrS family aminotransferase, partial [Armatimonadota bacterium]